ncbi:MAG: hypothetical protein ACYC0C_18040 [Devosia sp.]
MGSALFIKRSSGNVGIGTTSPGYRLTVADGGADILRASVVSGYAALETSLPGFWFRNGIGFSNGFGIFNANSSGGITFLSGGDITIDPVTNVRINGNVGIGTIAPQSAFHVPDGKYAQFEDFNAGAPPGADCDADAERGRQSIDTTNFRLYICMGAARGWDYATLTD